MNGVIGAGVILSVMGGGVFYNVLAAPNAWPASWCVSCILSLDRDDRLCAAPPRYWWHAWLGSDLVLELAMTGLPTWMWIYAVARSMLHQVLALLPW